MTEDNDNDLHNASGAFRAMIALLILCIAGGIAYYFINNPKATEKEVVEETLVIPVKIEPVKLGNYPITIEAMGQVQPARQMSIKAQVSGKIIKTSNEFIPGGIFHTDNEILKIDPADYALDIKVRQADLQRAQASYALEQGQQQIAKDELKILEKSTGKKLKSSDLALRKPQLQQARADLAAAKANLDLAKLSLSRTSIVSPFNALISERFSNLGDVVSTQDTIATLVDTTEYWIEVELPVQALKWITIPQTQTKQASQATIILDGGRGERMGTLLRVTGVLNEQSRLANVIISVADPLLIEQKDQNVKQSPLILEDFVRVSIAGKSLKNVARIPRSYIRDNNTIWIERSGILTIKTVEIAHQDRHFSYITNGLKAGDNIVTSNIITPVNGMEILPTNNEQ
ncbi:MAG: efflux RND transporter periplasmic adaptor subunit [Alphaproteobacteria bacterium]